MSKRFDSVNPPLSELAQRSTRRAPHMERYVLVEPLSDTPVTQTYQVSLKIGVQQFTIAHGFDRIFDTLEEAEWCRDMLCIALDALQKEAREQERASCVLAQIDQELKL